MNKQDSPTTPPEESKASVRDEAAKFTKRNYSLPSGYSVHEAMARFAIEYAVKLLAAKWLEDNLEKK